MSSDGEFHSNRWPQDRGKLVKVRVALDRDAPCGETLWARPLGCGREIGTAQLWAFDVSPEVDIVKVYDVLENGEAEGVWTFEEVHVGHELP